MQVPVVNAQQAGLVAASADMNSYAAACQFLLNPPAALALASGTVAAVATAQSLTASTPAAILWNTPLLDRDLTWNATLAGQFTVNTPGFYEVSAHAYLTVAAVTAEGWIRVTTGSNNPAGSGVTSDYWHASAVAPPSGSLSVSISGLIPAYCYLGDFLQFFVQASANCATTSLGSFGDWSHKQVSL